MMVVLARIETEQDARRYPRRRLRLSTSAAVGRSRHEAVIVHDISAGGLLIETSAALRVGDELAVDLPERQGAVARIVWTSGYFYGCELIDRVPTAVVSAALLKGSLGPFTPAPAADGEEVAAGDQGELSWAARARIIIAISALLWGAIIVGIFAAT